jgi:esterase/lipase superfamily enzyme
VTEGIAAWAKANKWAPAKIFEQVVLFAGDEGKSDWESDYSTGHSRASLVLAATESLKIYQSSDDVALMLSQCLMHDDARLGQPEFRAPYAFDVTHDAGYATYGHFYLVESAPVVADFSKLVSGEDAWSKEQLLKIPWLGWNRNGLPAGQIGARDVGCPTVRSLLPHG